jgi:hypothetical protein
MPANIWTVGEIKKGLPWLTVPEVFYWIILHFCEM